MQNNNDLRREFNKIMKYQEEVRKIHDGHREKFEETRKLVIKVNFIKKCFNNALGNAFHVIYICSSKQKMQCLKKI